MVGTLLTPRLIPHWIEIRLVLILCLIGLGFGSFLVGPVYTDLCLLSTISGLVITGLFIGPLLIPNVAEMMYAVKLAHPDCALDYANAKLSSLLNCCFALGQALGPILGAVLYQLTNFQLMNDSLAGFAISVALLYTIFAGGC